MVLYHKTKAKKMLKIWTDGSCLGNPGPGGWAFIATDGENIAERSGGAPNTTNNQMELTAVIRALAATRHHNEIEIHTTAAKKPVKNKELWQQLDELAQTRKIHWVWVRGHNGNTYNERCDELARTAAEKMK